VALAATCSTAEESAKATLIARLGRFASLKTLAGRHIYYPEPGDDGRGGIPAAGGRGPRALVYPSRGRKKPAGALARGRGARALDGRDRGIAA